jgi:hypothetical protein
MAQSVVTCYYYISDMTVLPEVHVRATYTGGADVDKALIGPDFGDGCFTRRRSLEGLVWIA